MNTLELVKNLEKYPHLKERLCVMLSVAHNTMGGYERADDIEIKICEEINKMGLELLTIWGQDQVEKQVIATKSSDPSVSKHQKKTFTGTQLLEKSVFQKRLSLIKKGN